jgi:HSP20 family protein
MADKSKRKKTEDGSIDLGFGGLFKGLGDLIDVLGELAEKGETEITRTGEINFGGTEGKKPAGEGGEKKGLRGVYGLTVRTGVGGIPRVERFGNIRATEEGPVVEEVREPLVDVFDEAQEIVIVAELPGVSEEDVRVEVQEDIVALEAAGQRKYAKEILLPAPVIASSLQKTYKNGILEVRLRKA